MRWRKKKQENPDRVLTVAEKDRKERVCEIQGLLNQGYPAVYIKKSLGVSYYTIRRYKEGCPDVLCRFPERQGVNDLIDAHRGFIIECLNKKMAVREILREINKANPEIKKTAFNDYCNRLKKEYGINNKTNSVGKEVNPAPAIEVKRIKRKDILKYLWTGEKLAEEEYAKAREKYEVVQYLEYFIFDFKSVFYSKSKVSLTGFIELYEDSAYSKIKSFINGLLLDIDAV
jgi:hypothetical protein